MIQLHGGYAGTLRIRRAFLISTQAYDKLGHEAYGSPPEEVTALVRAEHVKYSVAVREAKISPK